MTSSQRAGGALKKPIVMLIDLDHTLQGDIRPQIMEYELVRDINRKITNGPKIRYHVAGGLNNDFKAGLLRPNVGRSLRAIKKRHPNIEMFVYTASSHDWARYIVPKLEDVAFGGAFFNRPILTRNYVRPDGTKSINTVKPVVETTLKKKYGDAIKGSEYPIYLIDNNMVLDIHERKHLVQCPSYNYTHMIDPLRHISKKVVAKHFVAIANYFGIPAQVRSDREASIRFIYSKLNRELLTDTRSKTVGHIHDDNDMYSKDTFWRRVEAALVNSNMHSANEVERVFNMIRSFKNT